MLEPKFDLTDLEQSDRREIARIWTQTVGGKLPSRLHLKFARRELGWRLQARNAEAMPPSFERRLKKAVSGLSTKKSSRIPVAGGKLIRVWRAKTYEVVVLECGFRYEGRVYASLSKIAQEITGARWSGPRFFGFQSK